MITSRFIVQVKCTGMGWVNSQYSAHSVALALTRETELRANDDAWLSGARITRVFDLHTCLPVSEPKQ